MRVRRRRTLAITAAAAAVLLTFSLGGTNSSAEAAETANNLKTQYLTDSPYTNMPGSSVKRDIYLASGWYIWNQYPSTWSRKSIYLAEGWYTWRDTLYPSGGRYDENKVGYYWHVTLLDPHREGLETASLSTNWGFWGSGTRTWGSMLDPTF